jgi:two-component system, LytTR family, sensor kinase
MLAPASPRPSRGARPSWFRARRPPVWVFVSAAWLGPAILAAAVEVVQTRLASGRTPPVRSVVFQGGDWLLYALLTPGVFWMARRYPLTHGRLLRRLPVHVLGAVMLATLWALCGVMLNRVLYGAAATPYGQGILGWIFTTLPFGLAVYFSVVGVEHATRYFVEARDREAQAAELSAQLAEARLGALKMQLHPHFLLNSLNAITVIVRDRDTATATRMLEQLGEMLQRVMRSDQRHEVRLADELEFVRNYLAIEQVRFPDRLRVLVEVEAGIQDAAVPEFILQPLVENALRHGLARVVEPMTIRLGGQREGGTLVLTVSDDGPGLRAGSEAAGNGIGLGNIRQRLETMYGERASLALGQTPGGGVTATVRLPYHGLETANG